MADVGSANIDITADSSQARSEISGFTRSLQGIGKIATGVMGGLALFETIKGGLQGAYTATIGANASMEQYANTLTIVQGSAEKAAETIQWVKDFAAATPFEIPELVEATTALESYGLKAQDVLGTTGDMASAMGKPLMQAVEAVADAQTGELERLKEFGITKKMLVEQAAKMGKDEIVNASGQITDMEGLNEALFALMEERYGGAMEIQSTSFNGLISNATDSMGQMAMVLSEPIFEGLKSGLQSVVPVLGGLTAFIQGDTAKAKDQLVNAFGEETAGTIMGAFQKIQDGIDSFKQFLLDLQPTVENVKNIFISLMPVFGMVGGAIAVAWRVVAQVLPPVLELITGLAEKIVSWEGFIPLLAGIVAGFVAFKTTVAIVNAVKNAMVLFQTVLWAVRNATFLLQFGMLLLNSAFLANPIAWIVGLIVGLIAVFVLLYQKNEAFRALVDQVWGAIKNAFASVIAWATETLPAWWESMKQGFSDMVNGIVEWFSNFGTRIMEILQPFIDFFVQSWENLKLLVLGIIQVFISLVTGNFEGLKLGLLAIWTAVKNQAANYWNLLKNTVIALVVALWNRAVDLFQTGKDKVVNFVKSAKDGVVNGFREAKDNAISRVREMWNGIKDWVGKIPGKFQEMKDTVIEKVKSIDLFEIGKNIVKGLINGLGNMLKGLKDKAREIAQTVEKAIKDKLKLKSPSRVMIEIGYDTVSGFLIGLNDMMGTVVRKGTELGSNVAKSISQSTKNALDNAWDGAFQFTDNDPLFKYFEAIREDGDWLNDWAAYLPEKMKGMVTNLGKSIAPMLEGLKNWDFEEFLQSYMNAILVDGDYMNDWITHLPKNMRNQIMGFGQQFAQFEGLTQSQFREQQKPTEQHTHYWQVNADEITDVQSLIDVVNGIVQTVRSR
ncbi:hypothetical protein V7124_19425 [Neobacillus niacini]|uniref:phage tail protein n=1 Tax=Neobacillus niacini TaxID=86668 RepID=UPI002FFFB05A